MIIKIDFKKSLQSTILCVINKKYRKGYGFTSDFPLRAMYSYMDLGAELEVGFPGYLQNT